MQKLLTEQVAFHLYPSKVDVKVKNYLATTGW